jgi:hypothetical protein
MAMAPRRRCRRRWPALLPQQHRAADQEDREDARQQHERKAEPGGDDTEFQAAVAEDLHRVKGHAVFEGGVGEKLDRLDVGDGVDDLSRDHRAAGRAGGGVLAHPWHEENG